MQTGFAVAGVLVFSAPCFVSGLCYFSTMKGWRKGHGPDQIDYSAVHPWPQGVIKEGMGLTTNHWESFSWIFRIRTGGKKPLFQSHRAGRTSIWRCQLPPAPVHGESPLAVGEKEARHSWESLLCLPMSSVFSAQLEAKFTIALIAKCCHVTNSTNLGAWWHGRAQPPTYLDHLPTPALLGEREMTF